MLAGCAADAAPARPGMPPPSVVLITLDTTRADRMGFLGCPRGLTPNLDALARQGIVFPRAYAHVPLTTPSHASILTGTYPQFNHVIDLGDPLAPGIPYLPELLHQQGYATGAFVGGVVLDPQAGTARGFERGFDIYDAGFHHRRTGEDRYQSMERRADVVVDHAIDWLDKHPQRPVFLWVHVYDPHDPYDPPEPYKSRYASDLYDGEIAYSDAALGRLLARLHTDGLYDNAIVAVMADHGEAFGEHGEYRHGVFVYDETIHVPLVFKLPGQRYAGARVEARAGLADVAPTILQVLGITAPPEMQGQSLSSLMAQQASSEPSSTQAAKAADRPIYAESQYAHIAFGWSVLRSWRAGRFLYIQAPRRELYDEAADPQARHNLSANASAVADTMASQLEEFFQKTRGGAAATPQVDAKAAESLHALGYATADAGAGNENTQATGADPKDRIEVANLMHEGLIAIEDEQYQEAIPKLERAIKLDPEAGLVYSELGNALLQSRRIQASIPILRKAVELMPRAGLAHTRLAQALMANEDWAAAASEFQLAIAHSSNGADLHLQLGIVYERLQRVADATQEFKTAVEQAPDDFRANLFAGRFLGMQGHPADALSYLQKATTLDPDSVDAHRFLANVYSALGLQPEASHERDEAERLKALANHDPSRPTHLPE
ncbi:MAG TPA: sulfatase-like hydrolase/transferase [Terriglobales bacterium]|jgi:arylsulfatase A-like enzyme/Tfp pilus assembly protein PilF|nr:sulfatase-like hydrolase/transferase [Terriglobales bacterium]